MSLVRGDRDGRRVLAVVLLTLLIALAGCSGALNGSTDSAEQTSGRQSGASDGGGGGGVGSYYDQGGDRVIVREADMSVRVSAFDESFRELRSIADAHGGYVGDRSQRSEGEWDRGSITIRVPARNFSAARDDIADLGDLESENVRAMDFTNEYQNRQERIQQLESDRQKLQSLLDGTQNATEARQLRNELQEIRSELNELRNRQESLRQREALSTIRVDMHEPSSQKPPRNYESAFGFLDAFRNAFYGGLTAVKYVIVFFGYAIPVGIALLALATFGFGLYGIWGHIRERLASLFGADHVGRNRRRRGSRSGPPGEETDGERDDEDATE